FHNVLKHLYGTEQQISNIRKMDGLEDSEFPRYLMSSKLIHDLFDYLVEDDEIEKMCQCTGVVDEKTNTIVPTEILKLGMSQRSSIYVKGDRRSINNTYSQLDDYLHSIVIQGHRHPGSGPGATQPSSIDLRNHKDMEMCYPVIGIIFVKGGYFRFFSSDDKFEIEIYGTINGKEVVKVDDRTYRIQDVN
ncbi:MAG: hypothetical protein KKD98_03770, partial [Candidatus Thermoplasmatota archaeon]|nr:hypothetical protein [Candidatus Thermoplasmatota archaeon]